MIELFSGILILLVTLLSYNFYKLKKFARFYENEGLHYLGFGPVRSLKLAFSNTHSDLELLETYSKIKTSSSKGIGVIRGSSQNNFIVTDLELLKKIYVQDFHHFTDRFHTTDTSITSRMLFAMSGQKWREMRYKLTPVFATGRIKRMMEIFGKSGEKMVKYLNNQGELSTSSSTTIYDMKSAISKFTMDSITSSGYGIDSLAFSPEYCRPAGDGPCRKSPFEEIGQSIHYDLDFFGRIKSLVQGLSPKLGDFLGIESIQMASLNYFLDVAKHILETRRESKLEDGVNYEDFLAYAAKGLLRKEDNNTAKSQNSDDLIPEEEEDNAAMVVNKEIRPSTNIPADMKKIADEDIALQSVVFILGGFETVMSLNISAIHLLKVHQDVQENIFEEIQSVFKLTKKDARVGDLLGEMKYLDMFINEALRLYPPGMISERVCTKSYEIEGTRIVIQPGDTITIPHYGVHKNQEYFPEPDKFDLERFSNERKGDIQKYAFQPFGHGPRSCIGFRLALAETKMMIVHLVRNFKILPETEEDPVYEFYMSMMGALVPKKTLRARLVRRV